MSMIRAMSVRPRRQRWKANARRVLVAVASTHLLGCGNVPRIVLGDAPPSATDAGPGARAEAGADAGADAQAEAGVDAGSCAAPAGNSVTLEMSGTTFTLSNTLVTMTIDATGQVTGLMKNGTPLMAEGQTLYVSSEDTTGGDAGAATERKINATTQTIVARTPEQVELSFIDTIGSMNWDLHYVMQAGLSGFYYFLIADTMNKAPITLPELRTVQRFDATILSNGFNAERYGQLPTNAEEMAMLAADELQDDTWNIGTLLPGTPAPEGPVFTQYDWATYVAEDWAGSSMLPMTTPPAAGHGLYGNGFGVWLLTASPEYYPGGPLKQELMIDDGNTILNMYNGTHFGTDITAQTPANWQKFYGPSLVYVNTGTDAQVMTDAAMQAASERAHWPYCWVNSQPTPLDSGSTDAAAIADALYPTERAVVKGTVTVTHGRSAANAMVVLADPTELYSQTYGYIYWATAGTDGSFSIPNVRPGMYAVHVYAQQGDITADPNGDEVAEPTVTVPPGGMDLGAVPWDPAYHANLLWSIGTSDRTSGEFLVSTTDAGSQIASQTPREYGPSATEGLWGIPPATLTYTIGTSSPATDWYFAQAQLGTWSVVFGLDAAIAGQAYLTIAIAGVSNNPQLAVSVNGNSIYNPPAFGNDQTLYRSALTSGRYQLVTVPFPGSYLVVGGPTANTVSFELVAGGTPGPGIMYDFIKLEAD
jgi:rhamnogalacturonan endolyase